MRAPEAPPAPPPSVCTPTPSLTATASPTATGTPSTTATASPPGTAGGTTSTEALRIEIKDFKFSPEVLTARPGQTIVVTNRDEATHTLTADDGSIDSKDLGKDQSYTFTAPASGSVPYYCAPHPSMTGRIEIA